MTHFTLDSVITYSSIPISSVYLTVALKRMELTEWQKTMHKRA
ncbi:Uncharacterised protein [Vibrio cholerae]|nr:hypothetical protein OSU_0612 [Vibrio cholerae PS15]CSB48935.1 Uncharacterised protein [Vibrio cholerae]CSB76325.1 Uncharacterised protein [Vibrio cholerae]CSI54398.1 Uncharacterised protein [Vibrio cholerae]CSI62806.1 Uncharacterised protein [Vibrio cholerae]